MKWSKQTTEEKIITIINKLAEKRTGRLVKKTKNIWFTFLHKWVCFVMMIIIILLKWKTTENKVRSWMRVSEWEREVYCNRAYVMNVLTNYLKFYLRNSFCIFFRFVFISTRPHILIFVSANFSFTMNQLNILNMFNTITETASNDSSKYNSKKNADACACNSKSKQSDCNAAV